MRRAFIVDLAVEDAASDLSVGGVFVPNATVDFDDECQIVLRVGDDHLTVVARAVQMTETGVGFQIEDMTPELRLQIASLLEVAKHMNLELERKKTLERSQAAAEAVRRAAGSIPPSNRRIGARMAEGSISPIVALAPTEHDESLAAKARSAMVAADFEPDTDD